MAGQISREEITSILTSLNDFKQASYDHHLEIMLKLNSGEHQFEELDAQQIGNNEDIIELKKTVNEDHAPVISGYKRFAIAIVISFGGAVGLGAYNLIVKTEPQVVTPVKIPTIKKVANQ